MVLRAPATPVVMARIRVRRVGEVWECEAGRCHVCGRVYARGVRRLRVVR